MSVIHNRTLNKIMEEILLLFVVMLVCAAAFSGFFSKWQFRDNETKFGIEAMLDGTAHKPFVYRQLLPATVKTAVVMLPENPTADAIIMTALNAKAKPPTRYLREYKLLYILCYIAFFISILLLRQILSGICHNRAAGTLGALLFAVLFPLFETVGGYFYDFFEILFFLLAVSFSLQGNWLALILLSPVATLNKESFLFFIPTMLPLLQNKQGQKLGYATVASSMLLSGLTYLWIRQQYIENPGGMVEFHLWDHLENLFIFDSYFQNNCTYGIVIGDEMFLPYIIMILWVVIKVWKHLPVIWKSHAKLALLINGPLYMLFCAVGELRNFSLLYITFCIAAAEYIKLLLEDKDMLVTDYYTDRH